MITAFQDRYGLEVRHAWGMTEISPLGTMCTLKHKHLKLSPEAQLAVRAKQGRPIFGVDMKIVVGSGQEPPWDGKAFGDLFVKGTRVVEQTFKGDGGYLWAMLLARIDAVLPLTCPRRQTPMRIIAFGNDPGAVCQIRAHPGEPTRPPRCAPARGPPLWEAVATATAADRDPRWEPPVQPLPEIEFDQRLTW